MYFKRIGLFLLTNLAVIAVLAIVVRVFGLDRWIETQVGLSYGGLLLTAAIFGFGGAFASLALSKHVAIASTGMMIIERPNSEGERWLVETVHELAREAGIGEPQVGVYESPDPNAFATGARRDRALIGVSTGILRSMEHTHLRAVLGHEMAHVANGDMVTMALLQGVLNTFVIFAARAVGIAVDRAIFRRERGYGPGYWIVSIMMQVFLGLLATMIAMWFSRRREFRADAGGAELVGRDSMVAALRRLQAADDVPSDLPASMRAFGIRSGETIATLFRSHPPLEERIAALEHRPGDAQVHRPLPV